jgi:hypothetical protein
MSTAGPNLPSSGSQLGTPGRLAWDTPSLITAADSNFAQCVASSATYTQTFKLIGLNYGFTLVPGSVIQGITFTFSCFSSFGGLGSTPCRDGVAELMYQGNVVGQIQSSGVDWTAGVGVHTRTIGGTSNLWGWTPTYAQINDATFGVRFEVLCPQDVSAAIDWFKVTITYGSLQDGRTVGSGGAGAGGSSSLTHVKTRGTLGAGAGGSGYRKHKLLGSGGAGAGGAGVWRRIGKTVGTGGAGAGGGSTHLNVHRVGSGGAGAGGSGDQSPEMHDIGSGGAGAGGAGICKVHSRGTGGAGVGGASTYWKSVKTTGSGGAGAGNPSFGDIRREMHSVGMGGAGAGYAAAGASRRSVHLNGSGGAGAGGTGPGRRFNDNDPTVADPEDDIPRSHTGPVTRRMVYDAIRKALLNGPLSEYTVYIGDDVDMDQIQPQDNFAVIVPGSAENIVREQDGGGVYHGSTYGTMRTDLCEVRVYKRSSMDRYPKADAWALNKDGAMTKAREVRSKLHMLDLQDDAGWLLLVEPMRATTTSKADPRRETPKIGYYSEFFQVVYREWLG